MSVFFSEQMYYLYNGDGERVAKLDSTQQANLNATSSEGCPNVWSNPVGGAIGVGPVLASNQALTPATQVNGTISWGPAPYQPPLKLLLDAKLYWGAEPKAESDVCGNPTKEYIYLNGKRIAYQDWTDATGGVYYYFDHNLGSSSVVTDDQGNVVDESDYYPYGGENALASGSGQMYKFTGKELDPESGNNFFGARYYSSNMGRFLSPDYVDDGLDPAPIPWANFANPQSFNLYSYALNNPLSRPDPDGHNVQVCDNGGQCKTISNDAYAAAQSGNNGSLKVPTLDQVGNAKDANGNSTALNITDANGKAVGTAKYVAGESPGLDPFVGNNARGYQTMRVTGTVMTNPITYAGWEAASAAGAVCLLFCADAEGAYISAQTSANTATMRAVAYLESQGIPATAAAAMAAQMLSQAGTKPPLGQVLKFYSQQLNQAIQSYRQSQGSH